MPRIPMVLLAFRKARFSRILRTLVMFFLYSLMSLKESLNRTVAALRSIDRICFLDAPPGGRFVKCQHHGGML